LKKIKEMAVKHGITNVVNFPISDEKGTNEYVLTIYEVIRRIHEIANT
jgi:hypothetical protein